MLEEILKKVGMTDVFIIFIGSIAIIGIWRGTWNLLDKYLLPNNFVLSQLITISLGLLILIAMSKIRD